MSGPFHAGELRAQALAGVVSSGNGIRSFMPEQHRTFFAGLPFVLVGSAGKDGWPRAGVIIGAPGFIGSSDDTTLHLAVDSADGPLAGLEPGSAVGLLGIDFGNRRRNRANGVVRSVGDDGPVIQVNESFGNCPQRITLRDVCAAPAERHPPRLFEGLDQGARELVARADTFFVATTGGEFGIDISHRGGPPGFVEVDGHALTIPDYPGNRFFNTFGNLLIDPRAALLFIDFERGDVLELQGTAEIIWEEGGARHWRCAVARGRFSQAALPLRWTARAPG